MLRHPRLELSAKKRPVQLAWGMRRWWKAKVSARNGLNTGLRKVDRGPVICTGLGLLSSVLYNLLSCKNLFWGRDHVDRSATKKDSASGNSSARNNSSRDFEAAGKRPTLNHGSGTLRSAGFVWEIAAATAVREKCKQWKPGHGEKETNSLARKNLASAESSPSR